MVQQVAGGHPQTQPIAPRNRPARSSPGLTTQCPAFRRPYIYLRLHRTTPRVPPDQRLTKHRVRIQQSIRRLNQSSLTRGGVDPWPCEKLAGVKRVAPGEKVKRRSRLKTDQRIKADIPARRQRSAQLEPVPDIRSRTSIFPGIVKGIPRETAQPARIAPRPASSGIQ